jgi:hypothetical protein
MKKSCFRNEEEFHKDYLFLISTDSHSVGLTRYLIPWIAIIKSPTTTMPKKCAKTAIMARKNAW